VEKLTKHLVGVLRKRFPKVHTTNERIVVFEGPKFPVLRIWNLSDPIATGKIEIEPSRKLSLISYDINMSKYVAGNILILIFALIFMSLLEFPIMLVSVFSILILFFTLLVPCLAIMNFSSLIRKAVKETGGKIMGGV
jgi:hypothetical protein